MPDPDSIAYGRAEQRATEQFERAADEITSHVEQVLPDWIADVIGDYAPSYDLEPEQIQALRVMAYQEAMTVAARKLGEGK